jgi:flagellar hook-basal body complex protein FliE
VIKVDIKQVGQIVGNATQVASKNNNTDSGSVFSSIYQSAIELLDETNTLQKSADQMSLDFALGKIDNVQDVMIAQEKASIALQYTVQLRDSMLEAYNGILQIQI